MKDLIIFEDAPKKSLFKLLTSPVECETFTLPYGRELKVIKIPRYGKFARYILDKKLSTLLKGCSTFEDNEWGVPLVPLSSGNRVCILNLPRIMRALTKMLPFDIKTENVGFVVDSFRYCGILEEIIPALNVVSIYSNNPQMEEFCEMIMDEYGLPVVFSPTGNIGQSRLIIALDSIELSVQKGQILLDFSESGSTAEMVYFVSQAQYSEVLSKVGKLDAPLVESLDAYLAEGHSEQWAEYSLISIKQPSRPI